MPQIHIICVHISVRYRQMYIYSIVCRIRIAIDGVQIWSMPHAQWPNKILLTSIVRAAMLHAVVVSPLCTGLLWIVGKFEFIVVWIAYIIHYVYIVELELIAIRV